MGLTYTCFKNQFQKNLGKLASE